MLDDEQLARLDLTERELLMSLSEKVHGRQDQEHAAAADYVKRKCAELQQQAKEEAGYQEKLEATFV